MNYEEALEMIDDSIVKRLHAQGDEHPAMVKVLTTKSEILRQQVKLPSNAAIGTLRGMGRVKDQRSKT